MIDRLAVLLDQQDGAGNLAGRDLVAEIIADAFEFLRVEMRAGGNIEGAFRAGRSATAIVSNAPQASDRNA